MYSHFVFSLFFFVKPSESHFIRIDCGQMVDFTFRFSGIDEMVIDTAFYHRCFWNVTRKINMALRNTSHRFNSINFSIDDEIDHALIGISGVVFDTERAISFMHMNLVFRSTNNVHPALEFIKYSYNYSNEWYNSSSVCIRTMETRKHINPNIIVIYFWKCENIKIHHI